MQRFVAQCFKVQIGQHTPTLLGGHLLRVLCQPPAEMEAVCHRRAILAELVGSTSLRAALERLYLAMSRLRGLLENAGAGRVWDANRRKLEILAAIRRVCDSAATDFSRATSGLRQLGEFGLRVQSSEAYRALENQSNAFVNPAWRRWLAKLELLFRGYRFSNDEIMARLIDAVFSGLENELVELVQLFGDLEFYLGALGFRDQALAGGLSVCLPEAI